MSDSVASDALLLNNVCVRAGEQELLRNTSTTVHGGKITVLVGGSGTGKSVLLKILAGILAEDDPAIEWSGEIRFSDRASSASRMQRTGIVFQQFALFDELSPTANVQFAIDHRSQPDLPPLHSAEQWLQLLGVPADAAVAALSGGQKQRLAIARTLAADPEIIFYDEPTSGLDAATGQKVAELIRQTQSRFGRTSFVVTHDYATLLSIADEVLLLDAHHKKIVSIPPDQWSGIPEAMRTTVSVSDPGRVLGDDSSAGPSNRTRKRMIPSLCKSSLNAAVRFCETTGRVVIAIARLPWDTFPIVPRPRWAWRFGLHYLRLVGGPSACLYLLIAGIIAGFTTTYFTLKFLPFRLYTQPLLLDELLASIGFALYRILVPVLATVLIAARCGAAVAADVGVKQYGGQVDALKTFQVRAPAYLLVPIMAAFLIATPVLEWIAFTAAHVISRLTFAVYYSEIGIYFWYQHFFRAISLPPEAAGGPAWGSVVPVLGLFLLGEGWMWLILKTGLCGIGTAAIAYHHGITPKQSASDVSHSITSTVLWTTLYVLVVHFLIALLEF